MMNKRKIHRIVLSNNLTCRSSPLSQARESAASSTSPFFASQMGLSGTKKKMINDVKGIVASTPATICQWRFEPRTYTSRTPAESAVNALDE
jgi:hypothetical protein